MRLPSKSFTDSYFFPLGMARETLHFEKPSFCAMLISSPFSIENEQMTPTMKVRRHIVRDKYEAQLNKMYP